MAKHTLVSRQKGDKRYRCQVCSSEVLCTKAGEGAATCCGQDLMFSEKTDNAYFVAFAEGLHSFAVTVNITTA